jgi:Flp pilus assembly pilin Flp
MWTELNRRLLALYTRVQIQKDEGQALVEYTLILALVSIVAITALTGLGSAIIAKLNEVVEKL